MKRPLFSARIPQAAGGNVIPFRQKVWSSVLHLRVDVLPTEDTITIGSGPFKRRKDAREWNGRVEALLKKRRKYVYLRSVESVGPQTISSNMSAVNEWPFGMYVREAVPNDFVRDLERHILAALVGKTNNRLTLLTKMLDRLDFE